MHRRSFRFASSWALFVLALPAASAATWIAGDGAWGTPGNWDTSLVPCLEQNPGPAIAVIDTAVTVTQDEVGCTVDDLTLTGAALSLGAGTQLDASSATVDGVISGIGGNLAAVGSSIVGTDTRISATLGSVISLDAASLTSTTPANSSVTILSASGTGSHIDLSSMDSLDAGFNSGFTSVQFRQILASQSGTINLAGLTNLTGPLDDEDFLTLSVADTAAINLGSLQTVTAGGFVRFQASGGAMHDLPALSSAQGVQFLADGGSLIIANGGPWTYSFTSRPNSNSTLIDAGGPGTLVDLSSATSIDAGFDSSFTSQQFAQITAYNGAAVDLSGASTITGPLDDEDFLLVQVSDTAQIDLDALQSIDAGGYVRLRAYADGSLDLPSLSTTQGTTFLVDGGGTIRANSTPLSYTFTSRPNSNSDLMSAVGTGSLIDLSAVTSIDSAFNSGFTSQQFTRISAASDGAIDLSGVETIVGPLDDEDYLGIEVFDTATIQLDALTTVDAGGYVSFSASGGAVQELPALQTAQGMVLLAATGGVINADATSWLYAFTSRPNSNSTIMQADGAGSRINAGGISAIDSTFNSGFTSQQFSQIRAVNEGVIDLSGVVEIDGPLDDEDYLAIEVTDSAQVLLDGLQDIDAGGYVFMRASVGAELDLPVLESARSAVFFAESGGTLTANTSPFTYAFTSRPNSNSTIVSASGAGSVVDLSAATTLNSAFNSGFTSTQTSTLRAIQGGLVDLRNMETISLPLDAEDVLYFSITGASTMIMPSLETVGGNGVGYIDLGPAGARLEFPHSLNANDKMALVAGASGEIDVTGGLSFLHTDEASFDIEAAIVSVSGPAPLDIEVGGENLGATFPAGKNFAIGQLVIGSATQITAARLIDGVDNGNGDVCAAAGIDREALYLYGFDVGPEPDGLRILNGSTLDLGGLDVYANVGGTLTHLNPLITPGIPYAYDDGFLELGTVFDIDQDGVLDSVDNCVLDPNPDQEDTDGDGYGNACDADLNGDLFVNGLDLGAFKVAFFSTPADANWNPDADFNGDLQVNAIDLGILKLLFFQPPGPACPAPVPRPAPRSPDRDAADKAFAEFAGGRLDRQ